jgi:hypothetical protein
LITFPGDSQRVNDTEMLDHFPTPEEVVARIAARGPSRDNYAPPTESLAEVLVDRSFGISVDPAEWDQQWAEFEAEMDRLQREDDEAEGLL